MKSQYVLKRDEKFHATGKLVKLKRPTTKLTSGSP